MHALCVLLKSAPLQCVLLPAELQSSAPQSGPHRMSTFGHAAPGETFTAWLSGQSLPLALQSPAHLVGWTGTARIRWGAGNACRRAVALAPFLHLQVRCEEFRRCEDQACPIMYRSCPSCVRPTACPPAGQQLTRLTRSVPPWQWGVFSDNCAQERSLQSPECALPRTLGVDLSVIVGSVRWGPRTCV